MGSLHLIITTPTTVLVNAPEVRSVRAEDESGSFGVLAGHAPTVSLLRPGILVTISVQTEAAASTCTVYAHHYRPDAVGSSARFELFAPLGPGWQCYALDTEGDATFVAPLGLIPSAPHSLP